MEFRETKEDFSRHPRFITAKNGHKYTLAKQNSSETSEEITESELKNLKWSRMVSTIKYPDDVLLKFRGYQYLNRRIKTLFSNTTSVRNFCSRDRHYNFLGCHCLVFLFVVSNPRTIFAGKWKISCKIQRY